MKDLSRFLLLALLLSVGAVPLTAQWVPAHGPYGGWIDAVAVSGTRVFEAMETGVFGTTDVWGRWDLAGSGSSLIA